MTNFNSIGDDYWLTVEQTAEHMNVCTKTIYSWIKCGTLKAHRMGPRRLVVSIDDISAAYRPFGNSYERKF